MADSMALFTTAMEMPPINAIPAVVAAPPGIVTYNDIRLPTPRGAVAE